MAGRTADGDAVQDNGPEEKSVDLMCPINYTNTIPTRPSDLKLLPIQYNKQRFIQFCKTKKKFNFDNFNDLKLNIDLADIKKNNTESNTPVPNVDEILINENFELKDTESHVKKLKLTDDVSTENIQLQPQTIEKVDVKTGFKIKNNLEKVKINIDRESQLEAIEKTFKASKQIPKKHPSKPNVYAFETLEVFPDFKNWKHPCSQVIFDSNPAPVDKSKPAQLKMMSQAMLRGYVDEHGDHIVGYFLPSEETMSKRLEDVAESRHYDNDYQYEYTLAEKYDWTVKNKSDIDYEKNYFLTIGPDGVFYNEFDTTVHLKKRSPKFGAELNNNTNLKLSIQHIPSSEKEHNVYEFREKDLHPSVKVNELNVTEDAGSLTFPAKGISNVVATTNDVSGVNDNYKRDHNENSSDGHITIDNIKYLKNNCSNDNTDDSYESFSDISSYSSSGSCVYSRSILSSGDNGSVCEEDISF